MRTSLFISVAHVRPLSQYIYNTVDNVSLSYNAPTAMWLWAAAVADVLISACLWSTLRQRIQGDLRTDSLLRTLMHTTLKTAAYTSIIAVAGGPCRSRQRLAGGSRAR